MTGSRFDASTTKEQSFAVNFSSMASRNFVIFDIFAIFVGVVIFAVSSRASYYLICISLLLFVDEPAKFCNSRYFRSLRNNHSY